MKKTLMRAAAFFLAFAMVFGFAGGAVSAEAFGFTGNPFASPEAAQTENSAWIDNVMTADPFKALAIDREKIGTVTFLDSTATAPKNAWNMGKGGTSAVKAWTTWTGDLANVYFAADGGINGEYCTQGLFRDMSMLSEVNFNGAFHTDYADSMAYLFLNCCSLKSVNIESLNTENVLTTYEMFRGCTSLESIDVSSMNTSKVTSMYCMFSTCFKLKELDLSTFDTSNVTNMGYMFSACKALERVDVSTWNTSKVTNIEGMFRWCDVLEEPNLNSWDISNVKTYSNFMNPGVKINGWSWETYFK